MKIYVNKDLFHLENQLCFRYLYALYFIGLVGGICLAILFSAYLSSCFISELFCVPNFWNLMLVNLVPVLCISCLIFFSSRIFCYPVLLFVSVFSGFVGMTISILTGNSAWLIRILLMFSSNAISLYIWFLLHCWRQKRKLTIFVLSVFFGIFITLFDYYLVSRLLSKLIVYY